MVVDIQMAKSAPRGALIVFEGLDRSGKSTQIKLLERRLQDEGHAVKVLRFPDRSIESGKLIDAHLQSKCTIDERALHLLFSANRWEHADAIKAAVSAGQHVLCDRYAYSGVAYSLAKGLPASWVLQADIGLPQPDAVFYFEVSPETQRARGGFGDERLETSELQAAVQIKMKSLRQPSWRSIDANRTQDEVLETVLQAFQNVAQQIQQKPTELASIQQFEAIAM